MIIKNNKKVTIKRNIKELNKKNKTNKNVNSVINSAKLIKILSYNISWESMSGSVKNWTLCSNNTNPNDSKHNSVCVNNIADVFKQDLESGFKKSRRQNYNIKSIHKDNNNLDFITLQESTDFKKLIELSSQLKNMKYEVHNSGLDVMTTFWKPKYKLLYTIKGEFEKGRPWMATVFNCGICLINVHFGHYNTNEEYRKLENMIFTIKEEIRKKQLTRQLTRQSTIQSAIQSTRQSTRQSNSYDVKRFIISGDFNYNIKDFGNSNKIIKINGTNLHYNPKKILTCCIKRNKHYDHVIDSMARPVTINIPKVKYMASDHKPILVELVGMI